MFVVYIQQSWVFCYNCPNRLRQGIKRSLSEVKASAWNMGDPGSIPGLGRSPGEGNGNPLLPGESHGGRRLVGYSPWGHKESDTTERLYFTYLLMGPRRLSGCFLILSCPVVEVHGKHQHSLMT